jgi:hypothetical protein
VGLQATQPVGRATVLPDTKIRTQNTTPRKLAAAVNRMKDQGYAVLFKLYRDSGATQGGYCIISPGSSFPSRSLRALS